MTTKKTKTKVIRSKESKQSLLSAILYILVGVLCMIFKTGMLEVLFTIVGALFIIQGVISVLAKDTINGIINIVIGLALILGAWLFVKIILIIFGVLILIKGIQELLVSLKIKQLMPIVASVVTIVLGVLLISSNWLSDWFFIIIGAIFVINGALELFGLKK